MSLIMWQNRFSENENEEVEAHLHDIWIPRPKSRDIEIPRHFFRVQKATTSRFQDQKATTSSFCKILTLMPPKKIFLVQVSYVIIWCDVRINFRIIIIYYIYM